LSQQHIIGHIAHRPYPMPQNPWVMKQVWHELLFAHWPVEADALRKLTPSNVGLDTFDGEAWVGVVPFRMSGVRPRYLPAVPLLSNFPELNVRTYVKYRDRGGVFFFSLDAGNPLAVEIARTWFKLPYFNADMRCQLREDRTVEYRSMRTDKRTKQGNFRGHYQPVSDVFSAESGSLEHWLTARYFLSTVDKRGQMYKGEIHHVDWPLQIAEADIEENSVAQSHRIVLADTEPLLHYSHRIEVVVWPLERVT